MVSPSPEHYDGEGDEQKRSPITTASLQATKREEPPERQATEGTAAAVGTTDFATLSEDENKDKMKDDPSDSSSKVASEGNDDDEDASALKTKCAESQVGGNNASNMVHALDCSELPAPAREIIRNSNNARFRTRFHALMRKATSHELGKTEHRTLVDWLIGSGWSPTHVWRSLSMQRERLDASFERHGCEMKDIRPAISPSGPNEFGHRKKTLGCLQRNKTIS